MSLTNAAPAAEHEHRGASFDEAHVQLLGSWLSHAKARARLVFAEWVHATAEVRRLEGALAMVQRDAEGARLQ